MKSFSVIVAKISLVLLSLSMADAEQLSATQIEFFENKIRPSPRRELLRLPQQC